MRPFRLIATAALAVSLCGRGVARADAPWSAPVTIASGSYLFWQPGLAFTGDGHAVVILSGRGTRILAADPGASTFSEIGRAVLVDWPAVYGRAGVAYLRTPRRAPAPGRAKFARLGVSFGSVPGSLGRFRQLARVDVSQSGLVTARIAAENGRTYEEQRAAAVKTVALRTVSTPEDVANLALFLAGDESRTITGQSITCDAGGIMVG